MKLNTHHLRHLQRIKMAYYAAVDKLRFFEMQKKLAWLSSALFCIKFCTRIDLMPDADVCGLSVIQLSFEITI